MWTLSWNRFVEHWEIRQKGQLVASLPGDDDALAGRHQSCQESYSESCYVFVFVFFKFVLVEKCSHDGVQMIRAAFWNSKMIAGNGGAAGECFVMPHMRHSLPQLQ